MKLRSLAIDYLALTKPRLSLLAIFMVSVGFYMGAGPGFWDGPWVLVFLGTIVGTALLAASSAIFNQIMERDIDAKMSRTEDRPLPSGRLSLRSAVFFGLGTGIVGELVLLILVNATAATVGAFVLFFYLGIYTDSKKVSALSTWLGAIPGALPPVIGWAASAGVVTGESWLLFFIVFFWQIPHFLAIGWIYRDDYAQAQLPILNVQDPSGKRVVKQAVLFTLILLASSLLPFYLGIVGKLYLLGAILLGVFFLLSVVSLARHRSIASAKSVFRTSLVYLPLLTIVMLMDKV